jgi:hypothetical protein
MECPLCETAIAPGYEACAACGATKRFRVAREDVFAILFVCFLAAILFSATTYVAVLAVTEGKGSIDLVALVILVGLSALWLIIRWAKSLRREMWVK